MAPNQLVYDVICMLVVMSCVMSERASRLRPSRSMAAVIECGWERRRGPLVQPAHIPIRFLHPRYGYEAHTHTQCRLDSTRPDPPAFCDRDLRCCGRAASGQAQCDSRRSPSVWPLAPTARPPSQPASRSSMRARSASTPPAQRRSPRHCHHTTRRAEQREGATRTSCALVHISFGAAAGPGQARPGQCALPSCHSVVTIRWGIDSASIRVPLTLCSPVAPSPCCVHAVLSIVGTASVSCSAPP